MVNWPHPTNVTEVKSFIALASYYKRCVEGFTIYNNASKKMLGYMLIQNNKVIAYASRRWLKLIKDYDLTINYHPGKTNVVTDALSKKSIDSMFVGSINFDRKDKISIKKDSELYIIKEDVQNGLRLEFKLHEDDTLRFGNKLCVPNDFELK
ncbi:uncharacterized protein LOC111284445 [Durio zibethinus]|uniref:Uncharacterized protein LOC111284445 n=1 Tax=Durio zibethinus TaxID=66656 RepID=A0A6P5XKW1_DURZI|nr:uncharacterized protein LOC111284445 [Durio zibethinus]